MDIRKVKKLIELLESSSVDEIEIHEGEGSVRVTRHREAPSPHGAPLLRGAGRRTPGGDARARRKSVAGGRRGSRGPSRKTSFSRQDTW